MTKASQTVPSLRVGSTASTETWRAVPEETPIALVYDGATQAVMMATPADVEDFAVGFSMTEGFISSLDDVAGLEIVEQDKGLEARIWLQASAGRDLKSRRRAMAGPTGCGLCGVESLDAAVPAPPAVRQSIKISSEDVHRALVAMAPAQELNQRTRAVHAAAFFVPETRALIVREDVGRHNALDKLAGAVLRAKTDAASGFVVLTSRVSVEMVQKTAHMGAEVIVAVSAPTALAIRTAEQAGITLIAIARSDAFEVFTHAHRLAAETLPEARFKTQNPAA